MQGPELYLKEMGATLFDVVHPDQPAMIDAGHRAFVNYEVYYFSSPEALREFVSAPWKYTGKVTDPISMDRFQPTAESPHRSFGGRLFFLQSADHATTFDSDSTTYGVPRPAMRSKS